MNPVYFGDSATRLYGIYHPAKGASVRDEGVVLCYPMGQEYMRAHRAFRMLSLMLAKRGFHVFRFAF
ncbi:MAG: alpha/beta hydrolase, partial [Planctomycetota bacterium]|nr:alpha/beta hydrolase [Planctomycetota bacterium]